MKKPPVKKTTPSRAKAPTKKHEKVRLGLGINVEMIFLSYDKKDTPRHEGMAVYRPFTIKDEEHAVRIIRMLYKDAENALKDYGPITK